jgi:PTS system fructose-specific IIC component
MANIVAITSCPTGIAHTFMAAEGLEQGAGKLGHTIKVETQGSVGAQNQLTEADIAAADIVVIAADTPMSTWAASAASASTRRAPRMPSMMVPR